LFVRVETSEVLQPKGRAPMPRAERRDARQQEF
jgi:hypothetical protein